MPDVGEQAGEQFPHLRLRLEDEDPGHMTIVNAERRIAARIRYEGSMSRGRVLVVDDEDDVRELLVTLLTRAGFEVAEAADGRAALREFHARPPDLVVLDVSMPGLDGWQTLERIRDLSDVPVLMLTARAGELEKVRGLKSGADDYVTKPFGRQELVARVETLLRRQRSGSKPERYADALVEVDFGQREVRVRGVPVLLTPLEFRLLTVFVEHPNLVLSRDQLLDLVWGDSRAVAPEQVKLYVGYLRRKLGLAEGPIETVRGFGYRYRAER